jgi:hypothetical protein
MTSTLRTLALAFVCAGTLAPAASAAQPVATYHAVAVNMSDVGRRGMDTLDIAVERWTTDEEFAVLKDALVEKGSDALLSALQKTPRAGYIRPSNGGLGWRLQFARREPLPSGGYRVVIATDRPLGFFERRNNPRSADYEFLIAEMRVDAHGKGQGKLMPMARITFDDRNNELEIEGYATEPVRLTRVTENRR